MNEDQEMGKGDGLGQHTLQRVWFVVFSSCCCGLIVVGV